MKRKFSKKVKKKFVEGVVNGIPPSKICHEIFAEKNLTPESSHKFAVNLFSDKEVIKDIKSILLERGLSREGLSTELSKLVFNAKKESTKLKAIEMGFELHGDLGRKKDQEKKDIKILNLFIKNREARGLEIPKEIRQAMSEVIEQGKEDELMDSSVDKDE